MGPRIDESNVTTCTTIDSSTTYRRQASFSTAVAHFKLLRFDVESVRVFLRLYDAYKNEIRARAEQLVLEVAPSTAEIARPVNLKYCVEQEYLHTAALLGRIPDVSSYDALTDDQLRLFLEQKAKESSDTITLSMLDKIVHESLRMNMNDNNANSRMEALFVSYVILLRRHGLMWVQ